MDFWQEQFDMWFDDIVGYTSGILVIIWSNLPKTCDAWASVFGLIAILITLFGITIPKVIQGHKDRKECANEKIKKEVEEKNGIQM